MNAGTGLALFTFSCLFSIGVYLQCFTESEFILNPLIDTRLPPGFTTTKFKSIQPGMTKGEVLKILPPPEYLLNDGSWGYGNDGAAPFGDFAWFNFLIYFDQEGKVSKIQSQKFHD